MVRNSHLKVQSRNRVVPFVLIVGGGLFLGAIVTLGPASLAALALVIVLGVAVSFVFKTLVAHQPWMFLWSILLVALFGGADGPFGTNIGLLAAHDIVLADLFLAVVLGLSLLLIPKVWNRAASTNTWVFKTLQLLWAIWLMAALIGLWRHKDATKALREFTIFGTWIGFFSIWYALKDKDDLRRLCITIISIGVAVFILSWPISALRIRFWGFEGWQDVGLTTGSFSRTFTLAGALLFFDLGFRLSLSRLLLPDSRLQSPRSKLVWLFAFVICLLGVSRFLIRSLFLSALVGVAYILFYSRRNKATFALLILLGMAVLLLALIPLDTLLNVPGLQPYLERYGSIFNLLETSGGEINNILLRVEDWQIAWRGVSGSLEMVLGKGLSAPVDIVYSFGVVKEGYHNGYARLLFNTGLVGVLAYLLVHASIALTTHRKLARVQRDDRWLLVGLTSWFISAPVYFLGFGGVLGRGSSGDFLMRMLFLAMLLKAYAVTSQRVILSGRDAENEQCYSTNGVTPL